MPANLRERNRAATRAHIASVASRLFLAHGYDAVTLERIADEAEVSIRTVMRYFETKDQLALARYYDGLEAFKTELLDPDRSATALDVFRHSMHGRVLVAQQTNPDQLMRYFTLIESVPSLAGGFLTIMQTIEDLLADALAHDDGVKEPDLSNRVLASSIVYGTLAVFRHATAMGTTSDLDAVALSVIDYVSEQLTDFLPPVVGRRRRKIGS